MTENENDSGCRISLIILVVGIQKFAAGWLGGWVACLKMEERLTSALVWVKIELSWVENKRKQAWAELGQTQIKLELERNFGGN